MSRMQEIIDRLLQQGKRPTITFLPTAEVVVPKRRAGRPAFRNQTALFAHYADRRAHRTRPYCLKRGCGRRLGVNQRGACCQEHEDAVFNEALVLLQMIGATREEIAEHYRLSVPSKAPADTDQRTLMRPSERRLREARRGM